VIYIIAMIVSFTLPLLLLMDIDIPNPTDIINGLLMKFARDFFELDKLERLEPEESHATGDFVGQSVFPSWYHKGYNVQ
jgi:hypothetical protein